MCVCLSCVVLCLLTSPLDLACHAGFSKSWDRSSAERTTEADRRRDRGTILRQFIGFVKRTLNTDRESAALSFTKSGGRATE